MSVASVASVAKVQAVFYADPDGYPPIINSARLLAAAGHQVDILCRASAGTPNVDYGPHVSVRRIRVEARHTWQAYAGFLRQAWRLADAAASVFVGHDMHGFLAARLLAARFHQPLVYHCHDFVEDSNRLAWGGRLVQVYERRLARTADLVIVPDAERGQVIAKALRLARPPLVAANAPLRRAQPSTRLQEALAALGRGFSGILFRQGRIGPGHALEATLRSLPLWQDDAWGFVIMGSGDDAYNEHLRQIARRQGTDDRFVILPSVPYDQVACFTAGASVGHALYDPIHVNNRYITTASNKIMEYMAAGLPLLVSDRPGLRALVKRYDCGLTADESEPASIAVAVNTLLGDPDSARRMGANAARAFAEEFRYDRQFAPVLTALESLISARRI